MASNSSFPNVFNYAPQNLKKWRKARANVLTASGSGRILCVGDSTTMGVGSGNSSTDLTTGNLKTYSYPTQLAGLLNAAKINAHANSWCGEGIYTQGAVTLATPNAMNNDPRITVGSAWGGSGFNSNTLGGGYMQAAASTNALSFTPTVNVDTFVIYYAKSSGAGTIGFDINGGTQTTVNTSNASLAIASTTITGTLGANTLNIKFVSGATVSVVGVTAYDSSQKWIDVMNAGWSGGCMGGSGGNGNIAGSDAIIALKAIAPDLTIFNAGINDWVTGTSVSTYTTAYQSMITAALISGDVVLVTPNPTKTSGGGSASQAAQQALITAMYGLAESNNLPLIDLWSRFGDYTTANGNSFVFNDSAGNNYHPNTLGYGDIARMISTPLIWV